MGESKGEEEMETREYMIKGIEREKEEEKRKKARKTNRYLPGHQKKR